MGERLLPVVVMFAAVAVWWTRPIAGALREWNRQRRRDRWDQRSQWNDTVISLGHATKLPRPSDRKNEG